MKKKMEYIYVMRSIDAIKANIEHEKNIVREISLFLNQIDILNVLESQGFKINRKEKKLLSYAITSLGSQLKIINNSLPEIMGKISFFKELPSEVPEKKAVKGDLVSLKYKHPAIKEKDTQVTIKKSDKLKFLRELSLTDSSVRRIKKEYEVLGERAEKFKKPNIYSKVSNKLFLRLSNSLFEKGYFSKLNDELRKANIYFLSKTYISTAFFSSLLAFFASILLLIGLLFFNLSIDFPFLIPVEEAISLRFLKTFWVIFALPVLTFFAFYFYPSMERKSISEKINQELPFVTIHMSAIAGSGVEPTNIFKIIFSGKDYPNTKKEIKKLLNQINVYGYDFVTALRNSARVTSSKKLAELFKGLATTITSGGSLRDFLDKRSESLTLDYRIEREKYTRTAETFMDIYISVVIAAPMIMTMLLIMISLTGFNLGLSLQAMSMLMLLGIALLNIIFLAFLHFKQPGF